MRERLKIGDKVRIASDYPGPSFFQGQEGTVMYRLKISRRYWCIGVGANAVNIRRRYVEKLEVRSEGGN